MELGRGHRSSPTGRRCGWRWPSRRRSCATPAATRRGSTPSCCSPTRWARRAPQLHLAPERELTLRRVGPLRRAAAPPQGARAGRLRARHAGVPLHRADGRRARAGAAAGERRARRGGADAADGRARRRRRHRQRRDRARAQARAPRPGGARDRRQRGRARGRARERRARSGSTSRSCRATCSTRSPASSTRSCRTRPTSPSATCRRSSRRSRPSPTWRSSAASTASRSCGGSCRRPSQRAPLVAIEVGMGMAETVGGMLREAGAAIDRGAARPRGDRARGGGAAVSAVDAADAAAFAAASREGESRCSRPTRSTGSRAIRRTRTRSRGSTS